MSLTFLSTHLEIAGGGEDLGTDITTIAEAITHAGIYITRLDDATINVTIQLDEREEIAESFKIRHTTPFVVYTELDAPNGDSVVMAWDF